VADESDPVVQEGQATESPVETSFGVIEDEVGPDNSDAAPKAPEGHTEADAQSSETDVSSDETNRGYMRQQDYTRKTQDLAEERRAFQAEREQFLKEMSQYREQLQNQPQQAQHTQEMDGLYQLMNDPSLSPQDRAGVQTLLQIRQAQGELANQIREFQQFREELEPQFQQTTQQLQGLTRAQQEAQSKEMRAQGQEAVRLFGEDAVRDNIAFIQANMGQINPQTGEPFTVAQLVGMVTGKPAQEAQKARETSRSASRQAKAQVKPNGSHPSTWKETNSLEDSLAEISAELG